MSGAQIVEVIRRGSGPRSSARPPKALRGQARGVLEVSGLDPAGIDPSREYSVAGSDWELEPYGGYASAEWNLRKRYDFAIIIREAIEEVLRVDPSRQRADLEG